MNANVAELKAANAAAQGIRIYATSVLTAQGVRLSADQRGTLTRQADALRAVLGTSERQTIRVNVYDVYATDVKLGEMQYSL